MTSNLEYKLKQTQSFSHDLRGSLKEVGILTFAVNNGGAERVSKNVCGSKGVEMVTVVFS